MVFFRLFSSCEPILGLGGVPIGVSRPSAQLSALALDRRFRATPCTADGADRREMAWRSDFRRARLLAEPVLRCGVVSPWTSLGCADVARNGPDRLLSPLLRSFRPRYLIDDSTPRRRSPLDLARGAVFRGAASSSSGVHRGSLFPLLIYLFPYHLIYLSQSEFRSSSYTVSPDGGRQ